MIDPMIGRELGPYRLREKIGAGGMGTVYRAIHVGLDLPRAVKILPAHFAADPQVVTRFVREARTAARLVHPNIVSVHDVGIQDGIHFLAMDLVDGRSLGELLRQEETLPIARAISLLRQLAAALDAAHAFGVIHRDVKPGNVLIESNDHLKLVDFGIARALDATRLTGPSVIGTPHYMAPELWHGEEPGMGVDHYALGIVAFELLTGQVPFRGATTPAIMYGHLEVPPPSLRSSCPNLPYTIDTVFLCQLSKEPSERFPSSRDFVNALASAATATPAPNSSTLDAKVTQPNSTTRLHATRADFADKGTAPHDITEGSALARSTIAGPLFRRSAVIVAVLVVAIGIVTLLRSMVWLPDVGASATPMPTPSLQPAVSAHSTPESATAEEPPSPTPDAPTVTVTAAPIVTPSTVVAGPQAAPTVVEAATSRLVPTIPAREATVRGNGAVIRSVPDGGAGVVKSLAPGTVVVIERDVTGAVEEGTALWYFISSPERGFIHSSTVR